MYAAFVNSAQPGRVVRRLLVGLVIAMMIGALVILPWQVGKQAESIYRGQIANLNGQGIDAQVTSYQRGLYHSKAAVTAIYQGHRLKFTSDISHGPFILSGEDASARPVAAAITTTLELPSELESMLSDNSQPPLKFKGVVNFNGTLDLIAHVAPFSGQFGPNREPISFGAGQLETIVSGGQVRWTGTFDELRIATPASTVTLGKTELSGEVARDSSGMWLPEADLKSADYSVQQAFSVPNRGIVRSNFDFHGLDSSLRVWRDGATIHGEGKILADSAEVSGVKAQKIAATLEFSNLDPDALVNWAGATRAALAGVDDPAGRNRLAAQRAMALIVALAKDEPKAAAHVKLDTGFGPADVKADASISPQLASDPALKNADGSPNSWKLLALDYLSGAANLKLPAIAGPLLNDPITNVNLVDEGFFTADGGSIVTSANYAAGHLSIAGRQVF